MHSFDCVGYEDEHADIKEYILSACSFEYEDDYEWYVIGILS